MSYEIITDSSANLPEYLIEQYNVHVLSLVFLVKGKEYKSYTKGEVTDLAQFYKMMREKEHVTTSLVNLDSCTTYIRELLDEGKDLIYLGFSSALSGNYQAVSMLLEQLKEEYPNQKIYFVDTLSAALGQGLLVYYACKLREEGKTVEELYEWVLNNRLHLCHWFTVDDLFFLQRGGRVSHVTAIFGSMLSIKPVMHVDNEGKLTVVDKARGRRKSLDALVEAMEKAVTNPEDQEIFISHGDCIEDATYVANKVKEHFPVKNVLVHILDPVIGAHSGPGTVALFFVGKER